MSPSNLLHTVRSRLEVLATGEHLFMVFLAVIIGILGGFGAIGFRYCIKFFQFLFFGASSPEISYLTGLDWWLKILIPTGGGALVGLVVHYFASEVKGHGVPEVMEAVALKGGALRPRVMVGETAASAMSIASGGSVGREGPIIHIGAALGSSIGQILKITGRRLRVLVGCGAGAGMAATFNAPIAGALFAVEIILSDFGVAQFSPIVISSVTATVISRHFLGNYPAFIVPKYELVSAFELLPYAVIGVTCGLVAVLFVKLMYGLEDFFDSLRLYPPLKPAIGGACVGCIALYIPHVYGVGYETIGEALNGSYTGTFILLLLFFKFVATCITIGSGGSGGVFSPSLFLGATLGGFLGTYVHAYFPNITATEGAYALVGMGAFVAATTRAPITAILIIFELTDDYHIILPLMAACILSTLLGMKIEQNSIYTMKLFRRGINFRQSRDVNILKTVRVNAVMSPEVVAIRRSTPFKEIFRTFINTPFSNLFVVDDEKKLTGVISFHDLRLILPNWSDLQDIVVADDLIEPQRYVLTSSDTLDRAMHLFSRTGEEELPVVDSPESRRLIGFVGKKRVIDAYNAEILKRDTAFDIQQGIETQTVESEYQLADGYLLSTVQVPAAFSMKTLKELMLRNRYNVEVVLIRKGSTGRTVLPHHGYRLSEDDQILVIGQPDAIEKIKSL